MNIGQASIASGVSTKMIRYYESIDLVHAAGRSGNGYRTYGENDLQILRFIRQARTLGFPIEQIRRLLALRQNQDRASADVKAVAAQHIAELDAKIAELLEMRDALAALTQQCVGDQRPSCPILEGMSSSDTLRLARSHEG
ncbi:Cu(I)-responsive transcriptional regulator [Burkholderia diffusa]|uniref:Cu(I)-responsive transcriptional regulator n=1 Tax=Burkholderia diffusa TaxID=488732 RepID=UPI002AAFFAD7|nr:Cu(I)-responsive transcriptional regulator [Burkholderia diffusa]